MRVTTGSIPVTPREPCGWKLAHQSQQPRRHRYRSGVCYLASSPSWRSSRSDGNWEAPFPPLLSGSMVWGFGDRRSSSSGTPRPPSRSSPVQYSRWPPVRSSAWEPGSSMYSRPRRSAQRSPSSWRATSPDRRSSDGSRATSGSPRLTGRSAGRAARSSSCCASRRSFPSTC